MYLWTAQIRITCTEIPHSPLECSSHFIPTPVREKHSLKKSLCIRFLGRSVGCTEHESLRDVDCRRGCDFRVLAKCRRQSRRRVQNESFDAFGVVKICDDEIRHRHLSFECKTKIDWRLRRPSVSSLTKLCPPHAQVPEI